MGKIHKLNLRRTLQAQIITVGNTVPVICPVCEFVLRDDADVASVGKEKACTECTINFKHINLKDWKNGWRPTIKESRSKIVGINN